MEPNVTYSLQNTHTKLRNLYSKECRFLLIFQKALEISCISVFALNITMCVYMCVCVLCVNMIVCVRIERYDQIKRI